jgi:hypothetical protein
MSSVRSETGWPMDQAERLPGKWARGWRELAADLAAESAAEAIAAGLPPPPVWRPPPPQPTRRHRADVAGRAGLDPAALSAVRAELEAREWDRRRASLASAGRAGPDAASDDQAGPD